MHGLIRNFRDVLFVDMFGSEERKEYTLALYNALNGTAYEDEESLEIVTIDGAIYMAKRHDVAFIIDNQAVLWEQQSTPNPNMPLRALMYFSQVFERYVRKHVPHGVASLYKDKLITLPSPRFVVFYSGAREQPERAELHLSDAFGDASSDLDVHALVLNLGPGCNEELKHACPPLAEYAALVARVRDLEPRTGREAAVATAIDERIEAGVISDYLIRRKQEVAGMMLEEYDEAEVFACLREEAEEIGFEKGIEKTLAAVRELGIDDAALEAVRASLSNPNTQTQQ